jgi:hypothetical protein
MGGARLVWGAGIAVWLAALAVHGYMPGMTSSGANSILTEAAIQCLHDRGFAITSPCHAYGEPAGAPMLSAGPVALVGAVLYAVPWIGTYPAWLLAAWVTMALGLAGGYALARRIGLPPAVALGCAAAYLLSPAIIALAPLLGTAFGFLLLPAYVALDLWVADVLRRRGAHWLAYAAVGCLVVVRSCALFLDGYSFVVSAVLSAILIAGQLVAAGRLDRRAVTTVAALAGANLAAYLLYTAYAPYDFGASDPALLRAMSVDVATLLRPTESWWFWAAAGADGGSLAYWGDVSNSAYNYLGVTLVLLALAGGAALGLRRAAALVAAGLVTFVLALGPALKAGALNPAPGAQITYENYLMPEDAALAQMPWSAVYTDAPGIEQMRAVYRWLGGTRLILILLAGAGVAAMARHPRWGRAVAAAATIAVVIDVAPNVPEQARIHAEQRRAQVAMRAELRDPLLATLRRGERVFFAEAGMYGNPFLANYLAAQAKVRAYNVGGDKNLALAREAWPTSVQAIAVPGAGGPDAVVAALRSPDLDVVVVPFVDLRGAADAWPRPPEEVAAAEAAFAPLLTDPRLVVHRDRWFATLRPA